EYLLQHLGCYGRDSVLRSSVLAGSQGPALQRAIEINVNRNPVTRVVVLKHFFFRDRHTPRPGTLDRALPSVASRWPIKAATARTLSISLGSSACACALFPA